MKKRSLWRSFTVTVLLVCMLSKVCAAEASQVNLDEKYEIGTNSIANWPQGPEIGSDTGIIMEADTGVTLYEKGPDALRYPASITKLMTLLVAVENSSLEDQVTFTQTSMRDVSADSSNIGMAVGETVSMEECLYAMVLASANEVSTQIAEYVGGTEEQFIAMMNSRAQELGCQNTHFINANGLPGEGQYTTARDMALICQACIKNETACKIIETKDHTMPATNLNASTRTFSNHHPMMHPELADYYYEGCLGGKTGNTNAAGQTLVTVAERDGITYIAVVLKGSDIGQSCSDTRKLLDYAFQNFQKLEVTGGSVIVPNGSAETDLEAESTEQDGLVVLRYSWSGKYVGEGSSPLPTATPTETPVPAENDADSSGMEESDQNDAGQSLDKETAENKKAEPTGLSMTARILLGVMGAMAVVLVVLLIALHKKEKYR